MAPSVSLLTTVFIRHRGLDFVANNNSVSNGSARHGVCFSKMTNKNQFKNCYFNEHYDDHVIYILCGRIARYDFISFHWSYNLRLMVDAMFSIWGQCSLTGYGILCYVMLQSLIANALKTTVVGTLA